MNTNTPSTLIALTGGSGAGKTWLADRLCQEFGDEATSLSLDDFYCDLSHLKLSEREKTNFDQPDAIDWPLFETVLGELRNGAEVLSPRYDFVSHTRSAGGEWHNSKPFIFVEGLWLLWHPHVRKQFNFRVYLDCVQSVRWERREARDLNERGRTRDAIRKQFLTVVAPMHERFVEAQKPWADLVLEESITQSEFVQLVARIRVLRAGPDPDHLEITRSNATTPGVAAHPSI